VLAAPLIRLGLWEFTVSARDGVGHRFETIADSIAIGCVLSGARSWLHRQPLSPGASAVAPAVNCAEHRHRGRGLAILRAPLTL
jgi:hypothetical protein